VESQSQRGKTLLEELAGRIGRAAPPISQVEVLYGYMWPEVGKNRWRLYRSLDSNDHLEGHDVDLLAQRSFLSPAGDTLIYVRRGADVKVQTDSVIGVPQYTSWHPPRPREARPAPYTSWHPGPGGGS
jgi:hypothetical protein